MRLQRFDGSDCQKYGIFNVVADNVDKYSYMLGHHVEVARKRIARGYLHWPSGHSPVLLECTIR